MQFSTICQVFGLRGLANWSFNHVRLQLHFNLGGGHHQEWQGRSEPSSVVQAKIDIGLITTIDDYIYSSFPEEFRTRSTGDCIVGKRSFSCWHRQSVPLTPCKSSVNHSVWETSQQHPRDCKVGKHKLKGKSYSALSKPCHQLVPSVNYAVWESQQHWSFNHVRWSDQHHFDRSGHCQT